MRNQRRNKQVAFICGKLSSIDDYGKKVYGDPFPYEENLFEISGDSDIKEFGDRVNKMYKSCPPRKKWEGKIREGDVAYLEGASPFDESVPGENANYNVVSVRQSLTTLSVYFEKKP